MRTTLGAYSGRSETSVPDFDDINRRSTRTQGGQDTREKASDYSQYSDVTVDANVNPGQNTTNLDSLFTGQFLGHKSDIADGSLRHMEMRSFNHHVGDYYVAPRFMEKIAMHIAKNYLAEAFDAQCRIPLILGIWGPKGTGKTFQTELTFKKMGLEPIIMSAGELESEWAGTPGKLIRERYRKAAEVSRTQGKLGCLVINDLDAGIGRFGNTQVTVNNQIVVGTLMNICDDPEMVSVGQEWNKGVKVQRTPILVTGNDFSTLFAPLIRDGRMEKFYWEPNGEELVDVIHAMYKDDGLTKQDVAKLCQAFPNQPLDFFGALRGATYDHQIRKWIITDVVGSELVDNDADVDKLSRRLFQKDGLPSFEPVEATLQMLVDEGLRLAKQQQLVKESKLSVEYMKQQKGSGSLIGFSNS